MASYLGNSSQTQQYVSDGSVFSGDGSTLVFTLSRSVGSAYDIFVTVENVPQQPVVAYSAYGTTLTFTGAPPLGTNNIQVVYRAAIVTANIPPTRSVNPTMLSTGGPVWDANGKVGVNISSVGTAAVSLGSNSANINSTGTPGKVAGLAVYETGNVKYGISASAAGGLEISANQASQGIRFYAGNDEGTAPTLQMAIDSAGRVTKPNQPAFAAQGAPTTNTSGNLVFSGTPYWNVGGHYNNSNGRFTAPVAGLYFFYYHQLMPFADAAEFRIEFVKNGGSLNGNRFIFYKYGTNTWLTMQCTATFLLAAGDYIAPSYTSGPNPLYNDSGFAGFEGYLIR